MKGQTYDVMSHPEMPLEAVVTQVRTHGGKSGIDCALIPMKAAAAKATTSLENIMRS